MGSARQVGIGEIIEDYPFSKPEHLPPSLGNPSFDLFTILNQLIGQAIQRIIGQMLKIRARQLLQAADPLCPKGCFPLMAGCRSLPMTNSAAL